ncbi:MAG: IS66 family insertion sequence element accessory protein TnpA [Lacrimispora sphenoides]
MDEITVVKSQLRLQHWAALITECQASDQTVRAWCGEHDINEKTYYYWLRKVRKQMVNQQGLVPAPEKPVFKPLEAQTPGANGRTTAIVHLPGATVEVCEGASQQTMEVVLCALKTIC